MDDCRDRVRERRGVTPLSVTLGGVVYTEPDGEQEASVQAKRLDFGLMLFPTIFRMSTYS
jgi:hypothetical protein